MPFSWTCHMSSSVTSWCEPTSALFSNFHWGAPIYSRNYGVPMCMTMHFACMNFSVFLLFIFSKMITHFFPCDALILHYFNNVLYYHCSHQLHASYQDHWIFCVNNQLHHFQTSPPLLSTPISFIIPISNWHFFPVTHLAFCQLILTLFSFAYTFLHITSPKLRKMKFKSTLPSTNKFLIKYPVNLLQTAFGKIQAIFISFLVISLD